MLTHHLRRFLLVLLVLTLLCLVVSVCVYYWRPSVNLIPVSRGLAVEAVYATGVVEPVSMAKVAPLAAVRVMDILRREGDWVKRGDVLARLDEREAKANIDALLARRHYLQVDKQRQEALLSKNFVSPAVLEKLDSELRQVQAQLLAAQKPLAETVLRAPIAGRVLRQDGEIGEMVSAGQVLFWIGEFQPLRIAADVDEEDILRVQPGQSVWVKADALPGQPISGRVAEMTEKGDSVNKNYRVRIALPDQVPLKTGMTVEVNIVLRESKQALLVATSAIRGDAVWVVRSGRAERVPVKIGVKGQEKTEILSGLEEGMSVIAPLPTDLKVGDRVRWR